MSTATILPHTEEWHAARRAGIGASEIAAVLGISPWESPFSLYWRKVHGWTFEGSAEMDWGNRLEDAIAGKYQDNHPNVYLQRGELVANPVRPWHLATPDRLVGGACTHQGGYMPGYGCSDCMNTGMGEPPHAVLELKTAHNADGWGEPGTDEIPVYYRAQVLWQMSAVGVNVADVAVLIGGSDYREYTVRLDVRDLNVMIEAGRRFMARIANGDPPPVDDHHATLTALRRLHPDLDDTTAEVSPNVASGYARACAMVTKAKAVKAKYEAQLRAEMGSAARAESGGRFVASRSIFTVAETVRKAYDVDRLNPPRSKKS